MASSVSSPSNVDRSGESCHQCKTRRLASDLIFCSARHLKKGRARKKRKERLCRKKYCLYHTSAAFPSMPSILICTALHLIVIVSQHTYALMADLILVCVHLPCALLSLVGIVAGV